jgi:hypothetical protein
MALPIGPYQGQDLRNYEAGNKFLPREFYSLKTTPSTTLANQIGNTGGITGTQAAGSYMGYPSYEAWLLAQGGGGGGGGNGGGGRDDIITNTYNVNMGMSPGAMSGGLDEAKLPGFGNWAKRTAGTLGHIYSQLPTPMNLLRKGIRHWKGKRDTRRAEEQQATMDLVSQQSQANAIAAGSSFNFTRCPKVFVPNAFLRTVLRTSILNAVDNAVNNRPPSATLANLLNSLSCNISLL